MKDERGSHNQSESTSWPSQLFPGKRVSYEGHLCSIRWYGSLPGTIGKWLGVEWDDPSRGKHDGTFKSKQVFTCLYSDKAGSFIRPERKGDSERTVLQAIRDKYEFQHQPSSGEAVDIVVISGKVAEEVGFDKIAQQQAQLANLKVVLIDRMAVHGLCPRGSSEEQLASSIQELGTVCPNIAELDISYNFIVSWSDIVSICHALPKLSLLRANGLRFSGGYQLPGPLTKIVELHVEDCKLSAVDIHDIFQDPVKFPGLQSIHLSGNGLKDFTGGPTQVVRPLNTVTKLILDSNDFQDLSSLQPLVDRFPQVRDVSFRWNQITDVALERNYGHQYPNITSLNLSNNAINDYSSIDKLPLLLPNLLSLRVTSNPLFDVKDIDAGDARIADKSFYLTLARLPSLQSLNYSAITAKDREEGELYYISMAEESLKLYVQSHREQLKNVEEEVQRLYPRYGALIEKYDRPSIVDELRQSIQSEKGGMAKQYASGSLGSRIVQAKFYLPTSGRSVSLRLPSTLPVTQVMSLLLRDSSLGGYLHPWQFTMTFESKEFDPIGPTAEGSTRSATYGQKLSQQQKNEIWNKWGDWDADRLVAEALSEQSNDINTTEDSHVKVAIPEQWSENGAILIRDGREWKRREVVIPPALKRPWGQFLDGATEVTVRIDIRPCLMPL